MRSVTDVQRMRLDTLQSLPGRRTAAGISLLLVSALLIWVLLSDSARAVTEPVVAEAEFVAPITITETNALQYGFLDVNMAVSDTVIIDPDGTVTDTNTNVLGATQAAAALTVTSTAGSAITVLINNISGGTYYNLGTFMCDYAGGASTVCDSAWNIGSSSASTTLRVGATLTGLGSAIAGTDNGGFDVVITYQ